MRTIHTAFGGLAVSMMLATMAVAAETTPPPAAPNGDPMQQTVCRKQAETGSLVRSKKTCHSRAQWSYIDDANQADARKFTDDSTGKPASN